MVSGAYSDQYVTDRAFRTLSCLSRVRLSRRSSDRRYVYCELVRGKLRAPDVRGLRLPLSPEEVLERPPANWRRVRSV
jgi:hypothetical protein